MKMLVISACLVNYHDDRGGVAESAGAFIDVPKEDARQLAQLNRALYLDKKDDHTKGGHYTADKDLIDAAKKAQSGRGKSSDGG